MELKEAKQRFIQAWGTLGSEWGINRTMAQIHALLMVSAKPLSAEEIMEELNISRGNANMNIRALIDWRLVEKEHKFGERKEYFVAEKDIWEIARRVTEERRRRELSPVMRVLDDVSKVEGSKKDEDVKAFKETVANLQEFVGQADKVLGRMVEADKHWLFGPFLKMLK